MGRPAALTPAQQRQVRGWLTAGATVSEAWERAKQRGWTCSRTTIGKLAPQAADADPPLPAPQSRSKKRIHPEAERDLPAEVSDLLVRVAELERLASEPQEVEEVTPRQALTRSLASLTALLQRVQEPRTAAALAQAQVDVARQLRAMDDEDDEQDESALYSPT